MKVALLGATGFVGSALLNEALDRGHRVTAIVRHPEKLTLRQGLVAKAGDVYDSVLLTTLIRGHEALISAFNPGWKNPHLYDDQVRGTASIIAAVKMAVSLESSGSAGPAVWRSSRESAWSMPRTFRLGCALALWRRSMRWSNCGRSRHSSGLSWRRQPS